MGPMVPAVVLSSHWGVLGVGEKAWLEPTNSLPGTPGAAGVEVVKRSSGKGQTAVRRVWAEGRRRRGQQRMRWLDGITDSIDMNFSIGNLG